MYTQFEKDYFDGVDEYYEGDNDAPWITNSEIGSNTVQHENITEDQSGSGIVDYYRKAKELASKATEFVKNADNAIFGDIGTAASNTYHNIFNDNPLWRPGFAGERHLVLPTEYGYTRANYAGPGTKLDVRLNRGDKGVDGPFGIDEAARKHDIAYSVAQSLTDIRKADDEFIDAVGNSTQSDFMKQAVITGMKTKTFAEDAGLVKKGLFTDKAGSGVGLVGDIKIVKDNRKHPNMTPAQVLLKNMKKKKHKK